MVDYEASFLGMEITLAEALAQGMTRAVDDTVSLIVESLFSTFQYLYSSMPTSRREERCWGRLARRGHFEPLNPIGGELDHDQ